MLDWLVKYGTLLAALVGAVASVTGVALTVVKMRGDRREAERLRKADAPWATITTPSGDASSRYVRVTFWNPSKHAATIREVIVDRPKGWRAVMFQTPPDDVNARPVPDLDAAGETVTVNWTLKPNPDSPSVAVQSRALIIVAPGWSTDAMLSWKTERELPPIAAAIRFKGISMSATRAEIDLRTTNDTKA